MTLSALAVEPEGLDGFVEVSRAAMSGGLLRSDVGWLRTRSGCQRATLGDRADARWLTVPLCATDAAACTWSIPLETTWGFGMTLCERPDDTGWGGAAGGSFHGLPELVEHTVHLAVWRPVVSLRASFERHLREVQPCTPESQASAPGGERTCDTSTGYLVSVASLMGGGIGVGTYRSSEPVDCRRPCPGNPDLERVRQANAWLSGRAFVSVQAPAVAMYATEAACLASELTPSLELPSEECER